MSVFLAVANLVVVLALTGVVALASLGGLHGASRLLAKSSKSNSVTCRLNRLQSSLLGLLLLLLAAHDSVCLS